MASSAPKLRHGSSSMSETGSRSAAGARAASSYSASRSKSRAASSAGSSTVGSGTYDSDDDLEELPTSNTCKSAQRVKLAAVEGLATGEAPGDEPPKKKGRAWGNAAKNCTSGATQSIPAMELRMLPFAHGSKSSTSVVLRSAPLFSQILLNESTPSNYNWRAAVWVA